MRRELATTSRVKKFNVGTELRIVFGVAPRASLDVQPYEFDRIRLLASTIPASRKAAKLIMEELSFATTPEAKRHGLL